VSERERTGLAVIRVWIERPDGREGLRARITLVRDLEGRESESAVAADPEEIVGVVRRFVDDFVAAR
jgi:hypothetical protein